MSETVRVKISVYMDDGRVFEYSVDSADKAREHAHAIIQTGYRHTKEGTSVLEWYPPHRIVKIKIPDGAESTAYLDTVRAT